MTNRWGLVPALGLLLSATAFAAETKTPSDSAFAWLKGLAGTWEGKSEWSSGRPGGAMTARYALTGFGSAVEETFLSEGTAAMTSVYHEDGADLKMTHFCGAGNQPRLKATEIDEAKKIVRFQMIDITGRKGGHVEGVELRFLDENHVTVLFTFVGGAKPDIERIELARTGK